MGYIERKCIDPAMVEKSNGRKVCNDQNFKKYRSNDDCSSCPVATRVLDIPLTRSDFMSDSEKLAERQSRQIIHQAVRSASNWSKKF